MIIKKNMTKLYMHHFRGGLVYCCIVTHKKIFVFKEKKSFVLRCAFFLCLYHYLICLIFLQVLQKKKDLSASILSSCKHVCKM